MNKHNVCQAWSEKEISSSPSVESYICNVNYASFSTITNRSPSQESMQNILQLGRKSMSDGSSYFGEGTDGLLFFTTSEIVP